MVDLTLQVAVHGVDPETTLELAKNQFFHQRYDTSSIQPEQLVLKEPVKLEEPLVLEKYWQVKPEPRKVRGPPDSCSHLLESGRRRIQLLSENCEEWIELYVSDRMTGEDLKELLKEWLRVNLDQIVLLTKIGGLTKRVLDTMSIPRETRVRGLKSFKCRTQHYTHETAIIGAGIGGLSTALELLRRGNSLFTLLERHNDFGGHFWINLANSSTRLKTELETWSFISGPDVRAQRELPSRGELLKHLQEVAREAGLYRKTTFSLMVSKVQHQHLRDFRGYVVMYRKYIGRGLEGNHSVLQCSNVIAWPESLYEPRTWSFRGETLFAGYIADGCCNTVDYNLVREKEVVVIGHGTLAVENMCTCLENNAKKVVMLCRRRNLVAPKMASWLLNQSECLVPGKIIAATLENVYKLTDYEPMTSSTIILDQNSTFFDQESHFSVSDVYFLACYYGLCQVVHDVVSMVKEKSVCTQQSGDFDCDVILKALGFDPEPELDAQLDVGELVGFWPNADVHRPIITSGRGVQAGSMNCFSDARSHQIFIPTVLHFIDYPFHFDALADSLPRCRAEGRQPACLPTSAHYYSTVAVIFSKDLDIKDSCNHDLALNAAKFRTVYPLKTYLEECQAEWQKYISSFSSKESQRKQLNGDIVPPDYPFTVESMEAIVRSASGAKRDYAILETLPQRVLADIGGDFDGE